MSSHDRKNHAGGSRALPAVLTVICALLIALSVVGTQSAGPVSTVTGILTTPLQRGMNRFGNWLSSFSTNLTDATALREENESLKEQVEALSAENSKLVLDKEELERLQELLELKEEYSDYDTVGARVVARDSGNWFNSFTIDKGTNDGIQVDCNVIAGSGLVGIVTKAGPNWAKVRAIIDDNSNVSAMVSTTSDTCIIAGNLELIDEGTLSLVKLTDENNRVHVGDKVVTSNISTKYLPGILIGYISELDNDANNLTKSGALTPVVDFRHLQEVLVIRTLKEYSADMEDTDDGTASQPASSSGQDSNVLTAPRENANASSGEDTAAEEAAADGSAAQSAEGAAADGSAAQSAEGAAADGSAAQSAEDTAAGDANTDEGQAADGAEVPQDGQGA